MRLSKFLVCAGHKVPDFVDVGIQAKLSCSLGEEVGKGAFLP